MNYLISTSLNMTIHVSVMSSKVEISCCLDKTYGKISSLRSFLASVEMTQDGIHAMKEQMRIKSTFDAHSLTCTTLHITILTVIESFKSKDLRRYWESGQPRGINPNFARKVWLLMEALDTVEDVELLDTSGFGLHPLTGNRQGQWSMIVSRNWHITFRFEDGNAFEVDFEDYHGK